MASDNLSYGRWRGAQPARCWDDDTDNYSFLRHAVRSRRAKVVYIPAATGAHVTGLPSLSLRGLGGGQKDGVGEGGAFGGAADGLGANLSRFGGDCIRGTSNGTGEEDDDLLRFRFMLVGNACAEGIGPFDVAWMSRARLGLRLRALLSLGSAAGGSGWPADDAAGVDPLGGRGPPVRLSSSRTAAWRASESSSCACLYPCNS